MRASNPAVLLTPVSAGSGNITVMAAGSEVVFSAAVQAVIGAGTRSARRISSVTVGPLREGGQAQATVTLNGPVETRRIFKAKLRLVGQMNTRQRQHCEWGPLLPLSPDLGSWGGCACP